MIDLSIVIVSFNARVDLERCLDSLRSSPLSVSHEIVVVDNQSSDGSADAAAKRAGVRVIRLNENAGFARATNVGIRASSGENLLLLNSDTLVPAGAIDRLLAELRRDPDVAIVGPRLIDASGRPELSYGRTLGPFNELRQKIRRRRPALVDRLTRRRHSPDWVSGACLLVRRADAEAVGLLDERFFMYAEDVDFCAAIKARGRRIVFTPDAEIVHLRGRSVAAAPAATQAAYRRSQVAFYEKHRPCWVPLLKLYLKLRGQV